MASTDGPTDVSLISANVPGLLSVGILNAEAMRDDATGEVRSRASTADLVIGALPNAVSITLLEATCTATQSGNSGSTTLLGITAGNLAPIEETPAPNTVIEVPGTVPGTTILSLTLNEQISNPDGSLTVNAVHLRLFDNVLGSIGSGDVVLSSATCGPAGLPVPMASGIGLWISLGLIGMAVVPVAVGVIRRRQGAVQAV